MLSQNYDMSLTFNDHAASGSVSRVSAFLHINQLVQGKSNRGMAALSNKFEGLPAVNFQSAHQQINQRRTI